MKRVSLENMISGKESRYALVIGVAKRARQIAQEFIDKHEPNDDKCVLLAMEDFKNHKYNILEPEDDDE